MDSRKPLHETIFGVFGIVMAVVYVGLGVALLATEMGDSILPPQVKRPFGAALAAYGLFRLYRSIKQLAS